MSRTAARGRYYPNIGAHGRTTFLAAVQASLSKTLGSLSLDSDVLISGDPEWTNTVPSVIFIDTSGDDAFSFLPYVDNFDPEFHQFELLTGTLPTGVTLNPASGLEFDDSTGGVAAATQVSFTITDISTDDWATRSTAPGVVYANRLETLPVFNTDISPLPSSNVTYIGINGLPSGLDAVLDTSIKPDGAAGSVRFNVSPTKTTDPGYVKLYFGATRTFSQGSTVWCSFRMYGPPSLMYQPWASTASTGLKFASLSNFGEFHSNNQIVPGDPQGLASPHGFVNGVTFDEQQVTISTTANPSDTVWQPLISRGPNSLTGLNPDNGLPWTTTGAIGSALAEQDRGRYGPLRSANGSGGPNMFMVRQATGWEKGIGDWLSGQFRTPVNQWFTYTFRLIIGNWSTANSRWTVWIAPEGQPYTLIKDHQNVNIGNDADPNYSTLWLSHYVTARIAGGRKVNSRTNNITGVTIHAVGTGMPIGQGQMTWDVMNQRLSFAAFGESAGNAVGFSAANGKMLRNVYSGTSQLDFTDKYLIVEFTNGQLPVINQTDDVFIADGRPDTFGSYSEAIISEQPINAYGGFAPELP